MGVLQPLSLLCTFRVLLLLCTPLLRGTPAPFESDPLSRIVLRNSKINCVLLGVPAFTRVCSRCRIPYGSENYLVLEWRRLQWLFQLQAEDTTGSGPRV